MKVILYACTLNEVLVRMGRTAMKPRVALGLASTWARRAPANMATGATTVEAIVCVRECVVEKRKTDKLLRGGAGASLIWMSEESVGQAKPQEILCKQIFCSLLLLPVGVAVLPRCTTQNNVARQFMPIAHPAWCYICDVKL